MEHIILHLNRSERKLLQEHLLEESYRTWSWVGYAIILFQLLMLVNNLTSGVVSERSVAYRIHYICLIDIVLLEEVLMRVFRRHRRTLPLFYISMGVCMFAVFLWSIAITYIGFGNKQDLATFAYTLITGSAIVLLEPWVMILMLSCSSLLLCAVLYMDPALTLSPGTVIQILSTLALASIVTIVAFNRRLARVRLENVLAENLQEIQALNHQLQRDAKLDALTGLYNRRVLTEHINDRLNTGTEPSAVMMIDIDFFKKINDTYGHQTGDECLMVLGKLIRRISRGCSGYALRYGGEEFMIYFEHITEEALVKRAEQLREDLRLIPLNEQGDTFYMTVSIGYALARQEMSYSALIGVADEQLYLAKELGRDCICPQPLR